MKLSKKRVIKAHTKKKLSKINHYYINPTIYFSNHQTGKIKDIKEDKKRKAKLPGKRKSKSGKIYYEYRKNRSDRAGTRT